MKNVETWSADRLITTKIAADLLGRHPAVLADWRHQKRGPRYIKIGKSIRYRLSDIDNWIDRHTVDPGDRDAL
jgi:predicted DNA-binding transcriptional regulator AlpA